MTPSQLLAGKPRDAVRYGLQSAIAAAGAYALQGWAGVDNGLLAVISALFVLQLNSDETVSKGLARLAATAVGSAIAIGLLLTIGFQSVWLSLAVVAGLMGAIVAYKPGWTYGFVAGVALVIGSDGPIWETALNRGIAIAIGAAVGVAVSLIVWPESASTLVRRAVARALDACASILSASVTTAASGDEVAEREEDHRRYAKAISDARSAASSIKVASHTKADHHRDLVQATERLWNALVILDRVNQRQDGDHLELSRDSRGHLSTVSDHAANALSKLKELEPLDEDDRARIGDACDRARDGITREVGGRDIGQDEVEQLALLFGVEEVSDTLGRVDQALRELEAA